MKISEVMSKNVSTVNLNTTLREAAEKMRAKDIGALPVVDPVADKLKGMLTDRDIVVRAAAQGKNMDQTTAEAAMTSNIRYVFEDDDIAVAADKMRNQQIRRLVVLNRDKRLVGMLALSDLAVKGQDEHLSAEVVRCVSETTAQHAVH